jgi:hypothetical protein
MHIAKAEGVQAHGCSKREGKAQLNAIATAIILPHRLVGF